MGGKGRELYLNNIKLEEKKENNYKKQLSYLDHEIKLETKKSMLCSYHVHVSTLDFPLQKYMFYLPTFSQVFFTITILLLEF